MPTFDRSTARARWRRVRSLPLVPLAPVLAVSLALMFLPPSISAPLKGAVASALAPGQRWAAGGRAWAERRWNAVRLHIATSEEQQAMSREIARLREQNEDLETALGLALAREESLKADYAQSPAPQSPASAAPLVLANLVQARALGPQARSFLQRRELLDVGSLAELAPGSLVFAGSPAVLDQGRNARLKADDLALAGRRVAGKLVDVAAQTSSMRRVTEPGYRDLVQLAHVNGERLRLGAKGVLEGRGEPLCRIGLIEITEPVSAGDLVLAAGDGSSGAVYGRVARVERRPSDAHWQIWMAPAVGRDLPDEVSVLRLRLNPKRQISVGRTSSPSPASSEPDQRSFLRAETHVTDQRSVLRPATAAPSQNRTGMKCR